MDFFSNVSEIPKKWYSSYVKPIILMGVKKKKKNVHQVTLSTIVQLSYQESMWQKKSYLKRR